MASLWTLAASRGRPGVVALACLGIGLAWAIAPEPNARGQEGATPPHWIWPTSKSPGETPAETRYFRKTFQIKEPSRISLDATADNSFTLYLDGKEVARGSDWHVVKHFEGRIGTGMHVLAAEVSNEAPGPAGFLLGGGILPLGQGVPIHTNRSWRTAADVPDGNAWTRPDFDDSKWAHPNDLGPLGSGPWTGLVFESGDSSGRFKVPDGFTIATVAPPSVTGSAISFTFDAKGRPCVGVEQKPIIRLIDADKDGQYEDKVIITPSLKNCQGFSFIHGHLYAVGDGPKGAGLYRLTDADGDEVFEQAELIRGTIGGMGEHGPHTVMLGPDGFLYYNNGNHAHLKPPIDDRSPYNIIYEGELLPHYNDARGHAAGIMAPGGEILRSQDDGKTWERVVAGFRNEYDFAFNTIGELFTFDSDMEWDVGLPWYRPVRVNHCVSGAEFGWRNGAGKWPPYYFDSLPGTLDVGRGSPTGVTFYQGKAFPKDYEDNFIICDWSQGRILAVELTRSGASYKAREKELVTGQPLNCTDVEVGPDDALYFTTGGRGTLGGLYRVATETKRPAPPEDSFQEALGISSPLSCYAQARLAEIKKQLGVQWDERLKGLTGDVNAPAADRARALDLMVQFGQLPDEDLLFAMAKDDDPLVRAKAISLLGLSTEEVALDALTDAARLDKDPLVRRRALEALVRRQGPIPVGKIVPLLGDPDRHVRYAARIAIEHGDPGKYLDQLLELKKPRPRLEAMLAIVRATKLDAATQDGLFKRQVDLMHQELKPVEYLDLLRLIGLTSLLGPKRVAEVPASDDFREYLLAKFRATTDGDPANRNAIDRETARLLAHLGEPKAVAAILKAQAESDDHADQIHYANCLRVLKDGWDAASKRQYWAWFEKASHWDGGFSFLGYLDFMIQDFFGRLSPEERIAFLADGARTPFPTRILVRSSDLEANPERIEKLPELYANLKASDNPNAVRELQGLILEKLGRSARPEARAALRRLAEADPGRRDLIARAIANRPTADDLPILVAALDSRDPNTTNVVLAALRRIDRAPEGPEALRNLIRLARRTGPALVPTLNELAVRWTKAAAPDPKADFATTLKLWEGVYAARYPKGPPLAETDAGQHVYKLQELNSEILQTGLNRRGSPERGKLVLQRAKCLDCHKLGDQGSGLGPDLTTVSSRFRPLEILESIVEPSKVISDQYKPLTVATADGKVYNGMPAGGDAKSLILLLSDGTKVTIAKDEIEEQKESKVSVMPDSLLNTLSLQEIADLLALFEAQPKVEVPKGGGR